MTKDNWLTVAMVIAVIITAGATLLGPVLAVYLQSRLAQPSPKPQSSLPENLLQRLLLEIESRRDTFILMALGMLMDGVGLRRSKVIIDVWTIIFITTGTSIYFSVFSYWSATTVIAKSTKHLLRTMENLKSQNTNAPP